MGEAFIKHKESEPAEGCWNTDQGLFQERGDRQPTATGPRQDLGLHNGAAPMGFPQVPSADWERSRKTGFLLGR